MTDISCCCPGGRHQSGRRGFAYNTAYIKQANILAGGRSQRKIIPERSKEDHFNKRRNTVAPAGRGDWHIQLLSKVLCLSGIKKRLAREQGRLQPPAMPLYSQLSEMVKDKDYFALTTNVDRQFQKAGFQTERIFAAQGDYGNIQCEKGCHPKIYNAEDLFRQMDQARRDCLMPSCMVPKCPVCGGNMAMHLRCDQYFVEDENWHEAAGHYGDFLKRTEHKKSVLLELGVGFNTPGIIKYPFWQMKAAYVCINYGEAYVPEGIAKRSICISADIGEILKQL